MAAVNLKGGSSEAEIQRDLAKGFEAVQKRLAGEALAKYVLTTGGGYFFVPPPGDAWIDALALA
ncbi:hypothetical protein [Streptomyces niveus]|uniref:hypothetical protein n=1 Tax=Streptomyces niveus TaxID=193462 RepID=UPI00366107AF